MKREYAPPRPDWRERLAAIDYHIANHPDGSPYWREDQCYVLSEAEVEMFHAAASRGVEMVRSALPRVFEGGELARLGLPDGFRVATTQQQKAAFQAAVQRLVAHGRNAEELRFDVNRHTMWSQHFYSSAGFGMKRLIRDGDGVRIIPTLRLNFGVAF